MSGSSKEQIINELVDRTEYSREQIMKMIEDTIEDYGGLINEEGAAHMVANNLNISIIKDQSTTLEIKDLTSEGSGITLFGRVAKIYPTRTFTRKDGNEGKVRNISVVDATGEIRVALWDSRADEIEKQSIEIGDLIKLGSVNSRRGYQDQMELSLGAQSNIEKVKDENDLESKIPEIEKSPLKTISQINDVEDKTEISLKGKIVDIRDNPTEFDRQDGSIGKVTSIRVIDSSGQIRVTFWDNDVEKISDLSSNDVILLNDVSVGSSEYGKELTYRTYSTLKKIEDQSLSDLTSSPSMVTESNDLTSLKDVEDNMRGISVTGKIIMIGQLNSFERDGETNYVGNITISDTQNYQKRVTLWREQAKKINEFNIGDIISITNASAKFSDYSKEIELSVNDYSSLSIITDEVDLSEYEHDPEFLKFSDLTEIRRNVSVKVRLNKLFDLRTFTKDDGTENSVMNGSISDENGTDGRLAAWNDDISKLTELIEGNDYELLNIRMKPAGEYPAEVTINAMTEIKETQLEIDTTFQPASDVLQTNYQKTTLVNAVTGNRIEVQGNIVSIYPPSYYESCQACGKSANNDNDQCDEHGVLTETKMIITAMFDDTTDVVELKLFDGVATRILEMNASEAKDLGQRLRDEKAPVSKLLNEEYIIKGRYTETSYQDIPKTELHVDNMSIVDPSKASTDFLDSF